MIILESLDKILNPNSSFVLTIGNFDGVHLGHQKVLKRLMLDKPSQEIPKSIVITFDPHPVQFFDLKKTFKKLFSITYQNDQMEHLGIDYLIRLHFDESMANLAFDEFLDRIKSKISIKKIVIGHDLKIGKNRMGDRASIKIWCEHRNIEFEVVEPLIVEDQIVSSTFIKFLIEGNRFELVPHYLGRPYSIDGAVVHGDKRGRLIGFPTANLTCATTLYLPNFGVYRTRTSWENQIFDSITNVGKTPTFKSDDLIKVETHLFDFNKEIYGDSIRVEFIDFIRAEMKFSGIEEIKAQIADDIRSLNRKFSP